MLPVCAPCSDDIDASAAAAAAAALQDAEELAVARQLVANAGFEVLQVLGGGKFGWVFQARQTAPFAGGSSLNTAVRSSHNSSAVINGAHAESSGLSFSPSFAASQCDWPSVLESSSRAPLVVAIKVPRHRQQTGDTYLDVPVHSNLHHPHIVDYHTWMPEIGAIVLEWCSLGSVEQVMEKQPHRCTLDFIATAAAHISDALFYLHRDMDVLHLDLRPCNIVCTDAHRAGSHVFGGHHHAYGPAVSVKLTDFGMSRVRSKIGHRGGPSSAVIKKYVEQLRYRDKQRRWFPPELLDHNLYSEKTDVWSFGATLSFMLQRCSDPDARGELCASTAAVAAGGAPPCPVVPAAGSYSWTRQQVLASLQLLVRECCEPDVSRRLSSDVLKSRCESICLFALFHRHHDEPHARPSVPVQLLEWSAAGAEDEQRAVDVVQRALAAGDYYNSETSPEFVAAFRLLRARGTDCVSMRISSCRATEQLLFHESAAAVDSVPTLRLLLQSHKSPLADVIRQSARLRDAALLVHRQLESASATMLLLECAHRAYRPPVDDSASAATCAATHPSDRIVTNLSPVPLRLSDLRRSDWCEVLKFFSWALHTSTIQSMFEAIDFSELDNNARPALLASPLFRTLACLHSPVLLLHLTGMRHGHRDEPAIQLSARTDALPVDFDAAPAPAAPSSPPFSVEQGECEWSEYVSGRLDRLVDGAESVPWSYDYLAQTLHQTLVDAHDEQLWTFEDAGAHLLTQRFTELVLARRLATPSTMLALLLFHDQQAHQLYHTADPRFDEGPFVMNPDQPEFTNMFLSFRAAVFESQPQLLQQESESIQAQLFPVNSLAGAGPGGASTSRDGSNSDPDSDWDWDSDTDLDSDSVWRHPYSGLEHQLHISFLEIAFGVLEGGLAEAAPAYRAAVCSHLVAPNSAFAHPDVPADRAAMQAATFVLRHSPSMEERQHCRSILYARLQCGCALRIPPSLASLLTEPVEAWPHLQALYQTHMSRNGSVRVAFGLPVSARTARLIPPHDTRYLVELLPAAIGQLVPWSDPDQLHRWSHFLMCALLFCRSDSSAKQLRDLLVDKLTKARFFNLITQAQCEEWNLSGLKGYKPFTRLMRQRWPAEKEKEEAKEKSV